MEVTDEMRRAVEQEARDAAERYQRECAQRHTAWLNSMEDKLKAKLRETLPSLTDSDFDEIYGAFSDHFYEMYR